MTHPDTERLIASLRRVIDPELGQNIVDLGLVYEATVEDGTANITMTLTTPGCPAGPMIVAGVRAAAVSLEGVNDVAVELVWTPRWTPNLMSAKLRERFGISS